MNKAEIDALKSRVTGFDVARMLGHQVKNNLTRCLKPDHPDKTPSCRVYDDGCHCHGCGWHPGDVIAMYQEATGCGFQEAVRALGGACESDPTLNRVSASNPIPDTGWEVLSPPEVLTPSELQAYAPKREQVVTYRPKAVYPYRARTGALRALVLRLEPRSGGRKIFIQLQWARGTMADGRPYEGWVVLPFNKPYPLYGLHRLAECHAEATVVLVEGEKAADALTDVLTRQPILSWHGGTAAVKHANLQPLAGRRVAVWADNDDVGREAAETIADLTLEAGAIFVSVVQAEADAPRGWDAADAVEAGWDKERLIAHIKNGVPREAPRSTPRYTRPGDESRARENDVEAGRDVEVEYRPLDKVSTLPRRFSWLNDAPFRPLGISGSLYWFLDKRRGRLISLKAPNFMSIGHLQDLADHTDWAALSSSERPYAKDGKLQPQVISASLQAVSRALPSFRPMLVRGTGVWLDGDRTLVNLGDRLWVDGRTVSYGSVPTKYVYVERSSDAIEEALDSYEPLADSDALEVYEILCSLSWRADIMGKAFCGWITSSLVSGALRWRPHIQVTGDSSTGKSTATRFLKTMLGPLGLVMDAITPAALRRKLQYDARGVVLDEFEYVPSKMGNSSSEEILRYIRSASGGSVSMSVNMASHDVDSFRFASSFCLSSIHPVAELLQDRSRFFTCSLSRDKMLPKEEWDALTARAVKAITPQTAIMLMVRVLQRIDILNENINTYASAINKIQPGGSRGADVMAPLLAGAHLLYDGVLISFEDACAEIEALDWADYDQASASPGYADFLAELSTYRLRKIVDGVTIEETIGKLIHMANSTHLRDSKIAEELLRENGIWPTQRSVRLQRGANSLVKKLLRRNGSYFLNDWELKLKERKDFTLSKAPVAFCHAAKGRYIEGPISAFTSAVEDSDAL